MSLSAIAGGALYLWDIGRPDIARAGSTIAIGKTDDYVLHMKLRRRMLFWKTRMKKIAYKRWVVIKKLIKELEISELQSDGYVSGEEQRSDERRKTA